MWLLKSITLPSIHQEPLVAPSLYKASQFERRCCHSVGPEASRFEQVQFGRVIMANHMPFDSGGSILSTNHDLEIPMMSPTTNRSF